MEKFKDFKYVRPNIEEIASQMTGLTEDFKNSKSLEEQNRLLKEINKLREEVSTMGALAYIRHSIDTRDSFYEKEQEFLDETMPLYSKLVTNFYKELVRSEFREGLEKTWGKQLFTLAELELESFSEEIIEDLIEENKLTSSYSRLLASAKIDFKGETRTLSQLGPFMQSKDREVRKEANQAYNSFFIDKQKDFDEIFDKLVKVRDKMAKKLGYENFVGLAYKRLARSDYGPREVKAYRDQVREVLVPLVASLKERQANRINIKDLKYYDESLQFLSGNPNPKGGPEWIMEKGQRMYEELSEETREFFDFMLDKELMDLLSKEGKMSGGYCHFLNTYKAPFIFANFNGTRGDIDVLTHEAGHAFQAYMSRDLGVPEYAFPTYEASEIHSMSMEFITWPWMDLFFEDDLEKYKFVHLSGAISFIPYGVSVDEFQHFVYENPDISPSDRNRKWREIERTYLPYKDYDGDEFLEAGGFWYRQRHIFESPFYYIDYTLAQVCAFQFLNKLMVNRDKAWEDYLNLCKEGGSKSFLNLLKVARLENPFEESVIEKTLEPLENWLNKLDDKAL